MLKDKIIPGLVRGAWGMAFLAIILIALVVAGSAGSNFIMAAWELATKAE